MAKTLNIQHKQGCPESLWLSLIWSFRFWISGNMPHRLFIEAYTLQLMGVGLSHIRGGTLTCCDNTLTDKRCWEMVWWQHTAMKRPCVQDKSCGKICFIMNRKVVWWVWRVKPVCTQSVSSSWLNSGTYFTNSGNPLMISHSICCLSSHSFTSCLTQHLYKPTVMLGTLQHSTQPRLDSVRRPVRYNVLETGSVLSCPHV
jgi:hypothetical protein